MENLDHHLSEKTIARGTFWCALVCLAFAAPLVFARDAPDWVAVPTLCFVVLAAFATLASGIELFVRWRASSHA